MPKRVIELPQIEYLSILDEHGEVDEALEPDIAAETLRKMHYSMLLARRFDERLLNLQRQGRIGTFPPIKGHEAAHLGAAVHLRASDWMVPSFRELTADLWRGRTLESSIIYNNGFNEGMRMPEGATNLPISIPVGSQIPHAVGLGWAVKYRKKDDVVMTFFGDGATSEGDFHEAMNFAAVYQVPVVFVCQNNQWAISVPLHKQTRSHTLAQKAVAYGMPGIQVDGNDILAVYAAAGEAVERARSGNGPTLIECLTYRLIMHTTADDPKKYRTDEEVQEWIRRDPLPRFENYLIRKQVIEPADTERIRGEIDARIQEAVDRAEQQMQQPHDPLQMFEHVFAEMPEELKRQRRELAIELEQKKGS